MNGLGRNHLCVALFLEHLQAARRCLITLYVNNFQKILQFVEFPGIMLIFPFIRKLNRVEKRDLEAY